MPKNLLIVLLRPKQKQSSPRPWDMAKIFASHGLLAIFFLSSFLFCCTRAEAVPLPTPLQKQPQAPSLIETLVEEETPEQYLSKEPNSLFLRKFPHKNLALYLTATRNTQETLYFVALQDFINQKATDYKVQSTYAAGRAGAYAVNSILQQAADAHSLAAIILPSFLFQPKLQDRLYEEQDIVVTNILAKAPVALWVKEDAPWKSLHELVEYLREQPKGSTFLSGLGSYSGNQKAHLIFERKTGVTAGYLPFQGDAQSISSIHKGLAVGAWGLALSPETMQGMRALAVASTARAGVLPEVPTFSELGFDIVQEYFFGLSVLASTPKPLQDKVAIMLNQAAKSPELMQYIESIGFQPFILPLEEIPAFLQEQEKLLQEFLEEFELLEN